MEEYVAPELNKYAFNCPYCNAYAKMNWYNVDLTASYESLGGKMPRVAFCSCCYNFSLWYEGNMLVPSPSTAPMPHKDMPEAIKKDFSEAREILNKSPRVACALLRLSLQKLCDSFVGKKKDINIQIAELVKNGLPQKMQQAFDIVRVVGNNAVHPGEINVEDNPEIALKLFKLINMIIEKMITEQNELKEFYDDTISEKAKSAIDARNEKALKS